MRTRGTTALVMGALVAATLPIMVPGQGAAAAPRRADLVVPVVSKPPGVARAGSSFGVDATVSNTGTAAAGSSSLRFYLSKDRVQGAGDVVGGTVAVKSLQQRSRKAASGTVAVPPKASGRYWVIVCADARKQVEESNEKNNCRTSKTPVDVDREIHGTLTGDLTFTEYRQTTDPATGATTTVDHTASASIAMAVDGDPLDPTFASTGSTYTREGSTARHEEDEDCVMHRERTVTGGGLLAYTGDPFTDDINGSITELDLSGVHLGINLRAGWTEQDTYTGRGADPCDPYSKTTTGAELTPNDIDFVETSRSGGSIHYRVESFLGDMGTASRWDEVEGTLTLTLR
ncbi:CARDB domain-containing protein [Nocardioides sp. SR21]|uniref:CARDB domain-containing protein n=1 Tax=Nocardioides sp. SR21 TaxID=2919501 RepID=UPI001FAA2972|nr:CARDB domain-containing protein [Nocardioides sp. SR21]